MPINWLLIKLSYQTEYQLTNYQLTTNNWIKYQLINNWFIDYWFNYQLLDYYIKTWLQITKSNIKSLLIQLLILLPVTKSNIN